VAVRTYSKDVRMRFTNASDPAHVPNSVGGPQADSHRAAEVRWAADAQMVRAAYTPRPDDDDWGQARTLIRDVMDDEQRDRLVHNIVAHVSAGVKDPVLSRVFEYWYNIAPTSAGRSKKPSAPTCRPNRL
jgi:catalase